MCCLRLSFCFVGKVMNKHLVQISTEVCVADTCYIFSLCLAPQLFRHREVKKTKPFKLIFGLSWKKVGSVIGLNCSFHIGFAIILQENWRFIEPADWITCGNVSSHIFDWRRNISRMKASVRVHHWRIELLISWIRRARLCNQSKFSTKQMPEWIDGGFFFLLRPVLTCECVLCECESVLGYIQSFGGVSVSAILFVTLPAVSSVSLHGCACACWRRQLTGCDSHLGPASLLRRRRSPHWLTEK